MIFLREKKQLHEKKQIHEQKLTFKFTYYSAFQNVRSKERKKVFPSTPVIRRRNGKSLKDYLVRAILHCVKGVHIWSFSGLNMERYFVSLHIQSECEKMRTRITPNTDTFYAVLPELNERGRCEK